MEPSSISSARRGSWLKLSRKIAPSDTSTHLGDASRPATAEARYGERAHGDSKFRRGSGRGGEWSPSNDATSASGIGLGFHVFGHRSNPRHLPFLIVERYGGHPRCLATRWGTRIPLRARRFVARLSGYRFIPCDPVLRDRESEPARRKAWVRDQYQHPEEHRHTLAEVQGWFAENGVEYVRAYPSTMLCEESEELFANAEDNWRVEGWLAQLGWIRALGHEGGLFVTVGQRS